jgi:hypothetical protein
VLKKKMSLVIMKKRVSQKYQRVIVALVVLVLTQILVDLVMIIVAVVTPKDLQILMMKGRKKLTSQRIEPGEEWYQILIRTMSMQSHQLVQSRKCKINPTRIIVLLIHKHQLKLMKRRLNEGRLRERSNEK